MILYEYVYSVAKKNSPEKCLQNHGVIGNSGKAQSTYDTRVLCSEAARTPYGDWLLHQQPNPLERTCSLDSFLPQNR